MKAIIIAVLILVACSVVVHAGMIEYADDDPHQILEFSNCSSDSVDSIIVAVQVDPDSGYWANSYALADSIDFVIFGYIAPDRDSSDNLIPDYYAGEYWFYTITVLDNNDHIVSEDTTHVTVDYTISSGCGGNFHVD